MLVPNKKLQTLIISLLILLIITASGCFKEEYENNEIKDTDGDGYEDNIDNFPNDSNEWKDSDKDGHGDNSDLFPNDPHEWIDSDSDGIGNNNDTDDDNDGMPDEWELKYDFDPVNATDANNDYDNDNYTNLEEYQHNTNPLDSTDNNKLGNGSYGEVKLAVTTNKTNIFINETIELNFTFENVGDTKIRLVQPRSVIYIVIFDFYGNVIYDASWGLGICIYSNDSLIVMYPGNYVSKLVNFLPYNYGIISPGEYIIKGKYELFGYVQNATLPIWEGYVESNEIYVQTIGIINAEPTQITDEIIWQNWPDIYKDKIVWTDKRNGNMDIYLYNISTGVEKRITTNKSDQIMPKIWGNYIVWLDYRYDDNGGPDWLYSDMIGDDNKTIFLYNITSGEEKQLTFNESVDMPLIYEDYVFWKGYWGNITKYNISTGVYQIININTPYITNFDVYMNYLTWEDVRYHWDTGGKNTVNDNVFYMDMNYLNEIRLTNTYGQQWRPKISGDNICYLDSNVGNENLVLHNYKTDVNKTINLHFYERDYSFDISEKYVVGFGEKDLLDHIIFVYNIENESLYYLDQPKGYKTSITIYNNKIVWADLRDESHGLPDFWHDKTYYNLDIYYLDLSEIISD